MCKRFSLLVHSFNAWTSSRQFWMRLALSAVESEGMPEETWKIEVVAKNSASLTYLIAQMVNFFGAFVLYKFAVKPILAAYDERRKNCRWFAIR